MELCFHALCVVVVAPTTDPCNRHKTSRQAPFLLGSPDEELRAFPIVQETEAT